MLEVAEGIKAGIERITPTLPKGMSLIVNMDNSIAIEAAYESFSGSNTTTSSSGSSSPSIAAAIASVAPNVTWTPASGSTSSA